MEINSIAAIVTGGASGLGAATARSLAAQGARVTIFDLNAELGESLASELNGLFVRTDVTDEASVEAGIAAAEAKHGPTRVLVNCAGTGAPAKTVSKGKPHSIELFRKIIEINLIGTFSVLSKVAARMTESDPIGEERGVIVNTASVAAFEGQIGQVSYSASKGGIVGMTLPIARDLAQSGIRVLTIAPGLFLTPLLQNLPPEARETLGRQVPFPNRLGDPSEFAKLVCAIVENPMLNGETIRLDGAIRMSPK
ncbi:MAG: 3-hydroxyacyl-CoA dehydrogenase [Sphingomonadales bacterium]|nr:3-hydroxyacyl-CoA dehydrogenase [Sphingomonadales bacterium]